MIVNPKNRLNLKLKKSQKKVDLELLNSKDINLIDCLDLVAPGISDLSFLNHLPKLKYIMVSNANLKKFPAGNFKYLNLIYIKFKKCYVKDFDDNLSIPKTTKVLNLSDNIIESLPNWIEELDNLEDLDLSGNKLNSLPNLSTCLNINRLNLDSNCLESLPEFIYTLPGLRHLSIDNNPLTEETKNKIYKTFGIWF